MFERTIWWEADEAVVIDQTKLPHDATTVRWRMMEDAARGITAMEVRGAPLIGVAAAYGMALAMREDPSDLDGAVKTLAATRPTAVNLQWALDRMRAALDPIDIAERAAHARRLSEEATEADVAACRAIGEAGLPLIAQAHEHLGRAVNVLTHCNAGWLACVEWGTATAPVYLAHEAGLPVHVWVSETRPRNQGAALTAWELGHRDVPHTLIVDNAAGHLLGSGQVDLVITGADRIAANGDAANKIGTYLKAVAARDRGVPFAIAAPTSTFDPACPSGDRIPIEERDADEVLVFAGTPISPAGTTARNWGFDVTPARLVDHYITDRGLLTADDLSPVLGR
ncbi:MAG TPA: S-methyl-5-thioribose-1-phosphate isomerase [Euzebya sp.]|nr:S-methyl-5-thioribose-1-phosphate isomerase [Euzebya sp.]